VVQESKLASLRKTWAQKGNPACDHPHRERVHYLGSGTRDLGCVICGTDWVRGTEPPPAGTPEV
jgi:hypothetical protein